MERFCSTDVSPLHRSVANLVFCPSRNFQFRFVPFVTLVRFHFSISVFEIIVSSYNPISFRPQFSDLVIVIVLAYLKQKTYRVG